MDPRLIRRGSFSIIALPGFGNAAGAKLNQPRTNRKPNSPACHRTRFRHGKKRAKKMGRQPAAYLHIGGKVKVSLPLAVVSVEVSLAGLWSQMTRTVLESADSLIVTVLSSFVALFFR